jgi:hypothetical protein
VAYPALLMYVRRVRQKDDLHASILRLPVSRESAAISTPA